MGGVGILIGLGAMYGKLLADSGGADRIVDTLVSRSSVQGAALDDGPGRRADRAADVLRGRPGAADAGDHPGRPPLRSAADADRHPDPGRPVGHARPGAAAPRPAGRDQRARRQPRPHPGARRPRRHPHRHHRRPAVQQVRRPLGAGPGARPVRHRRGRGRRRHHQAAPDLRRRAGQHPDPGRADAAPARSPTSSGPAPKSPAKARHRLPRHAGHRPADRGASPGSSSSVAAAR